MALFSCWGIGKSSFWLRLLIKFYVTGDKKIPKPMASVFFGFLSRSSVRTGFSCWSRFCSDRNCSGQSWLFYRFCCWRSADWSCFLLNNFQALFFSPFKTFFERVLPLSVIFCLKTQGLFKRKSRAKRLFQRLFKGLFKALADYMLRRN